MNSEVKNGNFTEIDKPEPDSSGSFGFIEDIIQGDVEAQKNAGRVITRFPPEPNGFLHIGHAKSICLNFGLSSKFKKGPCHLRFDDTNPEKENQVYIDAIKEDVTWLNFSWGDKEFYASDYFAKLYDFAVELINHNKAYVCELSADEVRAYRGTLTEPGKNSPFRDRSIVENLALFTRMKNGEINDGQMMLRAKIDMTSGNLNMRDPVLYRVKKIPHHRTGSEWSIYPMYDFTHPLSDALEGVTHSVCTLEFEDHRPLYNWVLDNTSLTAHPQQIEFARLNLSYTVMSKRKLLDLVEKKVVESWDDPRMPTISGLRRRGYSPESIREFCARIGVAKKNSVVDYALLEACAREHLNKTVPRLMAVLNPLKVVIENYPEGQTEMLEAVNNPEDPAQGTRQVPFSRTLFIEREDFMEDPPKKFFRLGPGREVRLRYGYLITCREAIKNSGTGEIVELRCTYDPRTRGGQAPDGRRVKGTLHWVSAEHCGQAEVRLYDQLFNVADPGRAGDMLEQVNSESLKIINAARVEPEVLKKDPGFKCQFERVGYFHIDPEASTSEKYVINRTVTLRDTWSKIKKK